MGVCILWYAHVHTLMYVHILTLEDEREKSEAMLKAEFAFVQIQNLMHYEIS